MRQTLRLIALVLFGLLAPYGSHAQTIGTANFTYQGAFSLNSGDVLSLSMQIVGCGNGNLPKYNNLPISTTPNQTNLQGFTASGTQLVTAILPGNDKITCSTQSYTTYAATWLDNGFPIAPTQTFRLVDNSSVSLNTTPAVGFVPPVLANAAGVFCPSSTPVFLGFFANYTPNCATVAASGFTPAIPSSGGNVSGNIIFAYPFGPVAPFINGIPQADQFPGADMCVKTRAAEVYAIANGINQVDSTHFTGTQACSVDMFGGLAAANTIVNLTVNFGNVHITSTVAQTVTNSGLHIRGMGPYGSALQYTGISTVAAVLFVDGSLAVSPWLANGLNGFSLEGMFVYGTNANATDGIVLKATHRSLLRDVDIWGAITNGLHTEGAVTDTFDRVHVSATDAFYQGIQNGIYSTPVNGFEFDGFSSNKTTDGSCIDCMAEGVSGVGWWLFQANSMHFSAGTSENNLNGILVSANSKYNTFTSPDIEANTANALGVDVTDLGGQNTYISPIFASACTSCHSANAGGSGGQLIVNEGGAASGWQGFFNIFGVNSDTRGSNGTFRTGPFEGTSVVVDGVFQPGTSINNEISFQVVKIASSCAITAGAIGNTCNNTITFTTAGGVAEPDTNYKVGGCTATGGTGPWTTGDVFSKSTTTMGIRSVALSTSATGAGEIDCLLIHN